MFDTPPENTCKFTKKGRKRKRRMRETQQSDKKEKCIAAEGFCWKHTMLTARSHCTGVEFPEPRLHCASPLRQVFPLAPARKHARLLNLKSWTRSDSEFFNATFFFFLTTRRHVFPSGNQLNSTLPSFDASPPKVVKKAKSLGAVVTNGKAEGAGRPYPKHAAGLGAAGAHMAGCVFTLLVWPQRIYLQCAQKEEGGEVAKNFSFRSSWGSKACSSVQLIQC